MLSVIRSAELNHNFTIINARRYINPPAFDPHVTYLVFDKVLEKNIWINCKALDSFNTGNPDKYTDIACALRGVHQGRTWFVGSCNIGDGGSLGLTTILLPLDLFLD